MFEKDPKDLNVALSWMESQARERAKFNLNDAKQKMAAYIANDRRFDHLDPHAVAEKVQSCKRQGAHLNLEDPALLKGGDPRRAR